MSQTKLNDNDRIFRFIPKNNIAKTLGSYINLPNITNEITKYLPHHGSYQATFFLASNEFYANLSKENPNDPRADNTEAWEKHIKNNTTHLKLQPSYISCWSHHEHPEQNIIHNQAYWDKYCPDGGILIESTVGIVQNFLQKLAKSTFPERCLKALKDNNLTLEQEAIKINYNKEDTSIPHLDETPLSRKPSHLKDEYEVRFFVNCHTLPILIPALTFFIEDEIPEYIKHIYYKGGINKINLIESLIPNKKTIEAMKAARKGESSSSKIDTLLDDLNGAN